MYLATYKLIPHKSYQSLLTAEVNPELKIWVENSGFSFFLFSCCFKSLYLCSTQGWSRHAQEPHCVLWSLPPLLFSLPIFLYFVCLRQVAAVALAQRGGGGSFCILDV